MKSPMFFDRLLTDDYRDASEPLDGTHNAVSAEAKAQAAATAGGSISATYVPGQNLLVVSGDNTANAITISRDAAGTILVNGGDVRVTGGRGATLSNTTNVVVNGFGGDDTLVVDDSAGNLPPVHVFGGNGNDTIIGGNGADDLNGDAGDDTISGGAGIDTISGGAGNDTLNGGAGNDAITGGEGNDIVNGGQGNDTADLGNGNDTFVWNPGDASDTVDGNNGSDTLQFNGANIGEKFVLAANGGHVSLTRDIGTVVMDVTGIETINLTARGGADSIDVRDLSATGVSRVNLDLAGVAGTGVGDSAADVVHLDGSSGADNVVASSAGGETVLAGLDGEVHIAGFDAGLDTLNVTLGAGNDQFDASAVAAGGLALVVDGGTGDDRLVGSAGADVLTGSEGNDTVIGGAGTDVLSGGDGNDTVVGGAGNDELFGNGGDDTVAGGAGDDTAQLGDGDDTYGWAIGDGNDLVAGEAGTDTLRVTGSADADVIFIAPNGSNVAVLSGAESVDASGIERVAVAGGAGDDTISGQNGLGALVTLSIDGGDGNDLVTGGDGDDVLFGGTGNDVVNGGRGNDTIDAGDGDDSVNGGVGNDTMQLGAGDDTFVWNPGDGSDVADGGAGTDLMQFNGANIAEKIDLSAVAGHALFTRDIAGITMDLDNVERIAFTARGGADDITIHDLTGTDVARVSLDLAGVPGTGTGDAATDALRLEGGAAAETVTVTSVVGEAVIAGLAAEVRVAGAEASTDKLLLATGGGNDTIDATGLAANALLLTIDAGQGNDNVTMGSGDSVFVWHDGDGNDTVDGGAGIDDVVFNATDAAETFTLAANGSHVTLTRDVGNVTTDTTGIERLFLEAGAGADHVVVGDLAATDLTSARIDLGTNAGADGVQDVVDVNGGTGDDTINVAASGSEIVVDAPTQLTLEHADATDKLNVSGGAGNDTINAQSLLGTSAILTIDGGAGNDTIIGGHGADLLIGGAGDDMVVGGQGTDVAQLGDGNDTFVWNPGDGSDVVDGGAGDDTLLFNGANIAETIDLSSAGGRLAFTRNIGTVSMDVGGVETTTFTARGGVDLVTVHDLTGSGVGQVVIDLAGTPGSGTGDSANDVLTIEGTSGNDAIVLSLQNGNLVVDGLASQIVIENFELGDQIRIFGLDGDDIINASAIPAGLFTLVLDGGNGDDFLLGSSGDDTLLGGAGDDILFGGPGLDVLDGGPGANLVVQDAPEPIVFDTDPYAAAPVEHALLIG